MDTKKLRQKILDLAIHGKLVPQDPNDEPASVLLERIKAEKEQLIKEGKIKRQKKSTSSDKSHYGNDVPFEVPEGWVWCRLGDVLSLISGQDFPPEKYNSLQAGIPYITGASNLVDNEIMVNRWTEYPSVISENGDLLVVCKGAGVGKMAENSIGKAHIARQIQAVRNTLHILLPKYVRIVIEYNIQNIIAQANGLIPGLKRETLLALLIPIPPIEEQKRIVDEVVKWFIQIDAIEQDSSDLKDAVQKAKSKILDLALSGRLTSHTSHYGKNEESFSETTLGDVCKLCDGEKITGKDYTNIDVKYLRGTKSGDMLHSGKFVTAGSLMILVDGENSGEVFTAPIDGYQGSTFKILDIDSKYCKEFMLLLIQSNRKSLRENKVGSAIPHLNKKMFKEIVVPSFSYSEQCEISKTIQNYYCILDSIVG